MALNRPRELFANNLGRENDHSRLEANFVQEPSAKGLLLYIAGKRQAHFEKEIARATQTGGFETGESDVQTLTNEIARGLPKDQQQQRRHSSPAAPLSLEPEQVGDESPRAMEAVRFRSGDRPMPSPSTQELSARCIELERSVSRSMADLSMTAAQTSRCITGGHINRNSYLSPNAQVKRMSTRQFIEKLAATKSYESPADRAARRAAELDAKKAQVRMGVSLCIQHAVVFCMCSLIIL